MLPFIALNNIDFLRDGAAASYGSDVIAGVMNFETRSDFTGTVLMPSVTTEPAAGGPGDAWDSVGWVLGRSFGQDGPLRAEPVCRRQAAIRS